MSKTPKIEKNIDEFKRQTYYITELQIRALAIMGAHENIDKSEIVRQALNQYIPQKYMKFAILNIYDDDK